jgi:RHS repeat-associated protein
LAAGDQYAGLDAFGRVIDQRWTTSGGTAADRRQYGYDRDSNRLYADNQVSTSNSEVYAYDGLNQLTSFQRGTLNGTKDGIAQDLSRSQSWDFDALGNFDSQTTDGTTQTRSANKQNEVTSVSGATTPTYDAAGDMTGDEAGRQFVYDGWGRLVTVKNSGGTTLATYRYDGLNRRVRDIEASTTDLYYSAQWQVLEEDVGGSMVNSYAWSPVYVDALIARDAGGTRLYAPQDANWNVVALVTTAGAVAERYLYDSYGSQTVLDGSWNTRSGSSYTWTHGFQGRPFDAAAGGYNFRNREEDPVLGRWGRNDPLGFGGGDVDLYRSVGNAPTTFSDPAGLSKFWDWVGRRASNVGDAIDAVDLPGAVWQWWLAPSEDEMAMPLRLPPKEITDTTREVDLESAGSPTGETIGGESRKFKGQVVKMMGTVGLVFGSWYLQRLAGKGLGIVGEGAEEAGGAAKALGTPESIAKHLVEVHPDRFGKDAGQIAKDVKKVINKGVSQETKTGAVISHHNGITVLQRPDGSGTMVKDPTGSWYKNKLSEEGIK